MSSIVPAPDFPQKEQCSSLAGRSLLLLPQNTIAPSGASIIAGGSGETQQGQLTLRPHPSVLSRSSCTAPWPCPLFHTWGGWARSPPRSARPTRPYTEGRTEGRQPDKG